MILQALADYYRRMSEDESTALAPEGFEKKEIPFLIILDLQGKCVGFFDTRNPSGKKLIARSFTVPKERARSGSKGWQTTNILWDHYGYVLGWAKSESEKDKRMAIQRHATFVAEVKRISEELPNNKEIKAVYTFLEGGNFDEVLNHPLWQDCVKIPGCNLSFQINEQLVCQSDDVKGFINKESQSSSDNEEDEDSLPDILGFCLVSGHMDTLARLHTRTPIFGAKSTARIVSFQKNKGFDSYGKLQGYNAPVGKKAEFAYTTALKALLAKGSRQRMQVGDASTVFWAEKKNDLEDVFADIFGEPGKENPDQANKAIRILYESPKAGAPPITEDYTPFFVLGLAPNAARIAVRFWHTGTVGETAKNIRQHFDDCAMVHGPKQTEHLSLFRLLVSTALLGKSENIPPNIAGDFMRAILAGTPYPQTILAAAVRRCRAEREITYPRAALLKAVLARAARFYQQSEKEVGMALDTGNINIGYRLGRLFATLEKIQEAANPGINATIRDRFYGAASGTPVSAFPHLMKLKNHHLSKLPYRGQAVNLEKVIGEIMDGIVDFPTHLALQDQGRFAVGYYHQRQAFFTKNETN